jgi:gamma-glutamylcyclotransferase (GGCT)/AIG2-like uncharacterized protein YtfP
LTADAAAAVFVYGTLRQGEPNHALLASARFVGEARTPPAYTLVDLGSYPAMTDGGTSAVTGELYLVDAATLARLDELEEHPVWYCRREIALTDGRRAHAYLLPRRFCDGGVPIVGGDWKARSVL